MDKGFVPGVHSQESYVFVEEPTKGGVSLNPLPPSIDHKDQDWVTYSMVPHKERVIQTSRGTQQSRRRSRETPNRLGAKLQE